MPGYGYAVCWGVLTLLYAQSGLSLSAIWREYRYIPREYEFYGGEHFWGYDEERGVLYRFRGPGEAETLWRGPIRVGKIGLSRANPDETLLFEEVERLYRRSARYRVYLFSQGQPAAIPGLYQEGEILPDGRVVLADSQNLYLWSRGHTAPEKLTSAGASIRAGTTDWLYEEEFGFTKAFSVSPSGTCVAYLTFDNGETPHWSLAYYEAGSVYPRQHTFPYPKVGQKKSPRGPSSSFPYRPHR